VLGAKKDASVKTYYVKIDKDVHEVPVHDIIKDQSDFFMEQC